MTKSLNISAQQDCTRKKEILKQKRRECEDNTYSRDERHVCYRWAEKKAISAYPIQGGSHAAKI